MQHSQALDFMHSSMIGGFCSHHMTNSKQYGRQSWILLLPLTLNWTFVKPRFGVPNHWRGTPSARGVSRSHSQLGTWVPTKTFPSIPGIPPFRQDSALCQTYGQGFEQASHHTEPNCKQSECSLGPEHCMESPWFIWVTHTSRP